MAQPALMADHEKAPSDPDRPWRRLADHEVWPEIELRLRHKWSPYRVVEWLRRDHPKLRPPAPKTLYAYLKTREPEWFVTPLIVTKSTQAKITRLMVLEEHTQLLEVMKKRLSESLQLEQTVAGGKGFISPVVSMAMEQLSRLLEAHLKIQQSLGLMPRSGMLGAPKGFGAGEDDPGDDRGFIEFVQGMLKLPPDQFFSLAKEALGPPGRPENVIETTAVDVTPPREEVPDATKEPTEAGQGTLPGF